MTALVIADHDNASIKSATLNTVTAAKACVGDVHVLVAGENAAAAAAAAAQIAGVAKVIHADGASLKHGLAENIAAQVLAIAGNYSHILFPATAGGKNVAPRVAAKLDVAQISDITNEVFGSENFRNKISWKRKGGSSNPSNQLANVVEWILWYSKDSNLMDYTPIYSLDDENTKKYIKERFTNTDEDGRLYMKSPIQSPNYRENLIYDYKGYKTPQKGYSVSREVIDMC